MELGGIELEKEDVLEKGSRKLDDEMGWNGEEIELEKEDVLEKGSRKLDDEKSKWGEENVE